MKLFSLVAAAGLAVAAVAPIAAPAQADRVVLAVGGGHGYYGHRGYYGRRYYHRGYYGRPYGYRYGYHRGYYHHGYRR